MSLHKKAPVFHSLCEEEIKDPHLVFEELFDFADMDDARQLLWQWLKVTVAGTYHKELGSSEKAAIIVLYEKMAKLIEAAYVLKGGKTTVKGKSQKSKVKKKMANS
jgi:hypothetical protein